MVKPATTARPDTSAGAHSCEWQYGQTELGGWRSSPHSPHRWTRSLPSSPDVQKNVLLSVSSGSRRPDDSATMTPRCARSRKVGTLPGLPRSHYFADRSEPRHQGDTMPAQFKPTGGL